MQRYVVKNIEGRWTVLFRGMCYGGYETADFAVQAAIASARAALEVAETAEVAVEDPHYGIHTQWKMDAREISCRSWH
jgi:hypothetical protein